MREGKGREGKSKKESVRERRGMESDEMDKILSENRIEDVTWLCSLSDSELDFLISLKLLVLQRAKIIGHEELAKKFDLKMLRALALILMECSKGKVQDLSLFPGLAEPTAFMDGCNLLKCNPRDVMSIEELKACLDIDLRRKPPKRSHDEAADNGEKEKLKEDKKSRREEIGTRKL